MTARLLHVDMLFHGELLSSESHPLKPGLRLVASSALDADYVLPASLCPEPVLLCEHDGSSLRLAGATREHGACAAFGPLTFHLTTDATPAVLPRSSSDFAAAPALLWTAGLHAALLLFGATSPYSSALPLEALPAALPHVEAHAFEVTPSPTASGSALVAPAQPEPDGGNVPEHHGVARRRSERTDARPDFLALLGGALAALGEGGASPRYDAANAFGAPMPIPTWGSDSLGGPGRRGATCMDAPPCLGLLRQGNLLVAGAASNTSSRGELAYGSCGGGGARCLHRELPTARRVLCGGGGGCVADVIGALSRDAVRRALRAHRNELSFCYEEELRGRTDLEGRVETTFVIAPDGTTSGVSATSNDLPGVTPCVARALARVRFPESEGVTGVRYPLTFELN